MTELRARHIVDVYDAYAAEPWKEQSQVYLKSEADKVIAELKKACNDKDDWCLHTLKENRHQKYKRCLAMASKCRLRARWFGDNAFYKKEQWALQWHRRWLKIAEKFKEA